MKIHRFLFYLLLVFLPTQLSKYFFPEFAFVSGIRIDLLAPVIYFTDIVIVGIVLTWGTGLIRTTRGYFSKKTISILAVCFIAMILNISFAINPFVSFLKWLRIIETIFLTVYINIEKPPVKTSILFLMTGGFYSCVLAWLQFVQQSSIGGIFWWIGERTFAVTTPGIARMTLNNQLFLRPYATFPHPNVLAGFLTCLIPFVFYSKNRSHLTKLFFVPILISFLATIFITFSQTAWIIAVITTLTFFLREKGVIITSRKAFVGILIATCMLFLGSYRFVESESIQRRLSLAQNAFSIIKRSPIMGVGLNNFIIANQDQQINSYQDLQPVHSIYFLLLSETGTAGIITAMLVLMVFYNKTKTVNSSFHAFWSLCALLTFGLFDHYPLTIHQTLLFGGILTGFIFSTSQSMLNLTHGKRSK